MAIKVIWGQSGALRKRLDEIKSDADPGSYKVRKLREDIKAAVIADNIDKILNRSVDRYGQRLKELAPSTLKRRHGSGPPLAPRGRLSRVITTFQVRWKQIGGVWQMSAGWVDFLSSKGFPIMLAHLDGTKTIPRRDVGGVSPKGWGAVRQAFADFRQRLAKKGS